MDPRTFSITEFRDHLIAEGLAGSGDLVGCSEDEVEQIKRAQQVSRIPALYHDFLRVMGKSPYPLMIGTDWSFDDLLELKGDTREIFEEDGLDPAILDDALVIAVHQGYVVYYIPAAGSASDDPAVWTYVEGKQPTSPWPTFRAFLLSLVDMRRRALGAYEELEAGGRFTMTRVDERGDSRG